MMSLKSPARTSFASFNPYFRVTSWPAAYPIMQEFLDRTAIMPGWDNFGFTRAGDQLLFRSHFDDVESMLTNFGSLSPLMDQLLAGPATMDRLEFVGPAAQLARMQAATERAANAFLKGTLAPEYWETVEDTQTGFIRKSIQPPPGASGSTSQANTLCTMTPHYKIQDWNAARPLMQSIIDKANAEPGCAYFGWTKSGDSLRSRETFVSGDAMKAHIEGCKPLLMALKADGVAKLEHLEISAPAPELEKVKEIAASLQPEAIEYFGNDQKTPQVAALKQGSETPKEEAAAAPAENK